MTEPEDLGDLYLRLVETEGKEMADLIIKMGTGAPTRRRRQVPRTTGVKDKAFPAIQSRPERHQRVAGPGIPWKDQPRFGFQCKKCKKQADRITGQDTPDTPTVAHCACGNEWELTMNRGRKKTDGTDGSS